MSTPPSPNRKSIASSNPSPSHSSADQPLPSKAVEETKRPTDSLPMASGTFANLPMRFGRYQVEKLLGRGAMGAVYLARDTQLGRMVALKIPKLSGSGAAKLLQRLKTEAMAAALIDHPCLCAVYDTGEIDGTSFIAMQYIEGDTLKDVLEKQQPKTPQEAVALVIHLAEGLAEAHSKGIYHRDLKPENIKVNRRGLPVIMDFGLAKLTSTLSSDAGKTQRGTILGSPAYMSPEQAGGKLEEIDHRSDLYALGVILYEMLTGQRPFSGSALQVMGQKSVAEAPSVLTFNAELDSQLAAVCDKMLTRQRENRYQTAHEVVAALKEIETGDKPATSAGASSSWNVVSPVLPGIPVFERDDEGTSSIINRPRKRRPPQRRASSPGRTEGIRGKWRSMADWWHGLAAALRWSVLGGTGAVLLFAAIVLSFRTKDGILVLEVNEPGSEVFVNGKQITVKWDSGQKEATVGVRPGEKYVEIKKEGVVVAGKTLLFKEGERTVFQVQLKSEPEDPMLARADPLPVPAESLPATSAPPPATTPPLLPTFKNSLGMELVRIPPGAFQMGSSDAEEGHLQDETQHLVKITKAFYIGKFEVTKGEFRRFVDATGYKTDAEKDGYGGMGFTGDQKSPFAQGPFSWRNPYFDQPEDHPVSVVTWNDAVEFCKWLSKNEAKVYRLPTEAEWEYACRAGTTTRWSGGNDDRVLERSANIADASFRSKLAREIPHKPWSDGYPFSAPAGKFEANSFGLHDMHGNVWEWCNDWYDPKYYEHAPVNDPQGPNSGANRVYRGGCWWDVPSFSRTAGRYALPPLHRNLTLGFRVICEADETSSRDETSAKSGPLAARDFRPSQDVLGPVSVQPDKVGVNQWVDLLAWSEGVKWESQGFDWNLYLSAPPSRQGILLNGLPQARFPIPAIIDGSFELEAEFVRKSGNEPVMVYFPVGTHNAQLVLSAWPQRGDGLEWIDGRAGNENSTYRSPSRVHSQQMHKLLLRVKLQAERAQINVDMDDVKNYLTWEGAAASLANGNPAGSTWNISTIQKLWVGAWDSPTTFNKLQIRMLTGTIRRDVISETHRQADQARGLLRLVGEKARLSSVGWASFMVNQLPTLLSGSEVERLWPSVGPSFRMCTDYYGAHAPSRLKCPIPAKARSLSVIGYNHTSRTTKYVVFIDGREVYDSGVTDIALIKVDIPAKATLLELVIDPVGDNQLDQTYWCYPRYHSVSAEKITEEMLDGKPGPHKFAVALHTVGFGKLTYNQSIEDHFSIPLHFRDARPCDEFFFAHAPSTVTYAVPVGMTRFTAIGYNVRSHSVKFEVWADAKQIYESPQAGIIPIDIKLPQDTKMITLKVNDLGNRGADLSMWCYPRLHRK